MKDLDLDQILRATRDGQWSVHEYDWDVPLAGAAGKSRPELREMGLMLALTAGLERQAARIFEVSAGFVSDARARQIYELFAIDERRHAAAELLMARRYGVTWSDLPLATRAMFHRMDRMMRRPSRVLHEVTSIEIILFELGLDTLLIPVLREVDDPLQKEVFRRIDLDESRHLALDYWLLDRKGGGVDYQRARRSLGDLARLSLLIASFPIGFGATVLRAKSVQRRMAEPARIDRYWRRVNAVPDKAPGALRLPEFRQGVVMQRYLQQLAGRLAGIRPRAGGRPAPPA